MIRSMQQRATIALLAAALLLVGCGDKTAPGPRSTAASTPSTSGAPPSGTAPGATPPPTTIPAPDATARQLLRLLVPKGVPTRAQGEPADAADVAVVRHWLAALRDGDIPAAAATFADRVIVQNLRPPQTLTTLDQRLVFNAGFPCGAELSTASSVRGYLVVTYRLTDRKGSPCDGPGGSAAGTIRVEGGRITEWYRLPDPPASRDEAPGPVV